MRTTRYQSVQMEKESDRTEMPNRHHEQSWVWSGKVMAACLFLDRLQKAWKRYAKVIKMLTKVTQPNLNSARPPEMFVICVIDVDVSFPHNYW